MTIGIMVANIFSYSRKVFSSLESFSASIIAASFILAGSILDISLLPQIELVGAAYLLFRMLGKVMGATLGSLIITVLLETTIITELIGPISTKNAIIKAKETKI